MQLKKAAAMFNFHGSFTSSDFVLMMLPGTLYFNVIFHHLIGVDCLTDVTVIILVLLDCIQAKNSLILHYKHLLTYALWPY